MVKQLMMVRRVVVLWKEQSKTSSGLVGKSIDTAKLIADDSNSSAVLPSTIASTDAQLLQTLCNLFSRRRVLNATFLQETQNSG